MIVELTLAVAAVFAQPVTLPPSMRTLEPTPTTLTLTTEDGVDIAAVYMPAACAEGELKPAVIMVHGGGRSKERWWEVGLVQALEGRAHVIAFDIRRFGVSGTGDLERLQREPWIAHHELEAAYDWIRAQPGVDPSRLALIGSSYGANLSAYLMTTHDLEIGSVVFLSATRVAPLFIERSGDPVHDINADCLIMASNRELERYQADETAAYLAERVAGEKEVIVYEGPHHAAGILAGVDGALETVTEWLRQELAIVE